MKQMIGRREFFGKAPVAAVALSPLVKSDGLMREFAASEEPATAPAKSKSKTKKIGIEEHWTPPPLQGMTQISADPAVRSSVNPAEIPAAMVRAQNFEARLPLMDEAGVTMQVIATSSPGVQGFADAAAAIAMAKKVNDSQAEVIGKYPGRFAGFAALPTQDPKAAADELERAVAQLGFKGAMIQGHTPSWEYLDGQKFWVLWERAEALNVPIYLHIGEPPPEVKKAYEGHDELLGPAWSWGVEAATHALRIIGGGVFDAFPKVNLILGHMGESLPYLLARFDEGYAMAYKPRKLKKLFSEYIKENILITTSGKYRPETMMCAVNAMGIDRILFAEDYPYVTPKEAVGFVEASPLSDSDKEKIFHTNAERWLRL
jgi:2,3-dihydroxybenzoate decarboxylase